MAHSIEVDFSSEEYELIEKICDIEGFEKDEFIHNTMSELLMSLVPDWSSRIEEIKSQV